VTVNQEQIELLKTVLSYVLDAERQHFEESGEPAEHIYALALKALNGPTHHLRRFTMSKTFKQQPKQPKPMREATQRYKRERRKEQTKEWKSALEWRLGKDD
jgi:hypothetical protein